MKQTGNGGRCWEVNPNCEARRLADANIPCCVSCAAYEQKKGCWEMDWDAELKETSESELGFWKGFYNVGCRVCPVCNHHKDKVEKMVKKIDSL